jgi:voltage-gated potassium channel Kch
VTYTCSAESVVSLFHAESDVINNVGISLHGPSPDGVTRGHREHVDLVVGRLVNSDTVFVISRDRHSIHSHRAFRKGEALNHFSSFSAPCKNGRRRPVLTRNSNFSVLGNAESKDVIAMTHLLV